MRASRYRYGSWGWAVSVLLAACLALAPGCSLICYQVGALVDAPKREYEDVQGDEIREIPRGAEVSVLLKKGNAQKGTYKGLGKLRNVEESPTYLRLKTTEGFQAVDVDNIIFIRKKNPNDLKWRLLPIGAAVDVVLIALLYCFAEGMRNSWQE